MMPKRNNTKRIINILSVTLIMLTCFAVFLLLPVYVTRIIFENSLFVAKAIVYIVVLMAVGQGIIEQKLHMRLYIWINKRFGINLYKKGAK